MKKNTNTRKFKNILIVCNPQTKDTELIRRAILLFENQRARLTIVDVLRAIPHKSVKSFEMDKINAFQQAAQHQRKNQLEKFIGSFGYAAEHIAIQILSGDPSEEIIQTVVRNKHDLVMLTADGPGPIQSRFLGVMSMRLIRRCPCAVWVVKPVVRKIHKSIVAAIDLGKDEDNTSLNKMIMDRAASLALVNNCKLHVVHACDFYLEALLKESPLISNAEVDQVAHEIWGHHEKIFRQLVAPLKFKGLHVEKHYLKGEAGKVIVDFAADEDADLVVLGTVNRVNRSGMSIGSTAEEICHQVHSSVLVLKPEGFIRPIETVKGGVDG